MFSPSTMREQLLPHPYPHLQWHWDTRGEIGGTPPTIRGTSHLLGNTSDD